MARFIGFVQGQRGPAHRLGSASSGLTVEANTWQGGVRVALYAGPDDRDHARITVSRGSSGHGETITLFDGPVDQQAREMLSMAERQWIEAT